MSQDDLSDGWLPMRTAPRDGTMILITDIGNGEEATVMPAAFLLDQTNPLAPGDFWAVWPTSYMATHLWSPESQALIKERRLPVDFRNIAITPVCWKPFPMTEPMDKLRRRHSQICSQKARDLRAKYPHAGENQEILEELRQMRRGAGAAIAQRPTAVPSFPPGYEPQPLRVPLSSPIGAPDALSGSPY